MQNYLAQLFLHAELSASARCEEKELKRKESEYSTCPKLKIEHVPAEIINQLCYEMEQTNKQEMKG